MSAQGALRDLVQGIVDTVVDALRGKDKEQDKRMDAIEGRLDALEGSTPPAATRARKNVKAQAGTAEGSASASSARGEASSA